MSKTRLEQIFDDERRAKFGIDRLEYEQVQNNRETLPISLDNPSQAGPQAHWERQMAEWKQRFGIDRLSCEGLLGARLEQAQTLADAAIDDAKVRMRGMKLKTATASYQGKPIRLWLEISQGLGFRR